MKTIYFLFYLWTASVVFAQGQTNDYLSSQPVIPGADLLSRLVDLEVRQILLERKVKALEERLQQQGLNEAASKDGYRMHPRHIEVIKKDRPNHDRQPEVQYPIYPIVTVPYGNSGNDSDFPAPPVARPGP